MRTTKNTPYFFAVSALALLIGSTPARARKCQRIRSLPFRSQIQSLQKQLDQVKSAQKKDEKQAAAAPAPAAPAASASAPAKPGGVKTTVGGFFGDGGHRALQEQKSPMWRQTLMRASPSTTIPMRTQSGIPRLGAPEPVSLRLWKPTPLRTRKCQATLKAISSAPHRQPTSLESNSYNPRIRVELC